MADQEIGHPVAVGLCADAKDASEELFTRLLAAVPAKRDLTEVCNRVKTELTDWYAETRKWVDATVKAAAAESPENKALLEKWIAHWRDRADSALMPVAQIALGAQADALTSEMVSQFNARLAKAGVAL